MNCQLLKFNLISFLNSIININRRNGCFYNSVTITNNRNWVDWMYTFFLIKLLNGCVHCGAIEAYNPLITKNPSSPLYL